MRDRFAALGVADEVLAQIIWAEWSEDVMDLSTAQLLQWAARLLPEDSYACLAARLPSARDVGQRTDGIVPFRKCG